MASVHLEHVSKTYPNRVTAVRDLSLSVPDGELVVLVGPSGCGKTTTLRLLAGLEEPTDGTIHIGGRVVNRVPPRDRDVAMVFQRPALYPHLSVRRNLLFGLEMRQMPGWLVRLAVGLFRPGYRRQLRQAKRDRDDRVAEAARWLRLEDVLDRRPAELSGGQQQRVALGRAVVRRPAVFLLDEPFSSLDVSLRAAMRRQLHLLHGRLPATIIHVTHDPVEAMSLADRLVVLREGALQQAGPPQDLYDRPCNRFVAGLLGWPPMSFLDGHLTEHDGRPGLAAGACFLPLTPGRAAAWKPYAGRPVTLGIRPAAVGVAPRVSAEATLLMRRALVERLGDDVLVTYRRDGWEVTGLVPKEAGGAPNGQAGEEQVCFNLEQAHLFDQASGVALSPCAE